MFTQNSENTRTQQQDIAALEQKKSRQDAEALRKAQKEEIDKAIQQLLDDGMSMEEVLNKLKR